MGCGEGFGAGRHTGKKGISLKMARENWSVVYQQPEGNRSRRREPFSIKDVNSSIAKLSGTQSTVVYSRFALIALVALKLCFDSALRKLSVHPKHGCNGTVSRAFPVIALIALGAFLHSTPGAAYKPEFAKIASGDLFFSILGPSAGQGLSRWGI